MPDRIISRKIGSSNVYLVPGEKGYLLIDTGNPGRFRSFKKLLLKENITPEEITLILITHVHHDHVGNLRKIKELTGAKVMVHNLESEWLATGKVDIPRGTIPLYRFISAMGQKRGIKLKFPPVEADIKITGETSLKEYGHDGRIIPTPGHSIGSLSLFFDDGKAFVGDACFNYPAIKRTILPGFAEDIPALFYTWRFYLSSNTHTFYPGHGRPFGKEKIERTFEVRGYLLEKDR
jgi:hydroxyacylglutathione hydrolase